MMHLKEFPTDEVKKAVGEIVDFWLERGHSLELLLCSALMITEIIQKEFNIEAITGTRKEIDKAKSLFGGAKETQ